MFNFLTETVTEDTKITFEQVLNTIVHWIVTDGVKLVIGLFALLVSFYIINIISKKIRKRMLKKERDKTITSVVYQIIRKGSKILLFILFLGYVGVDTAGIGSIIASAGLAIGLALQGSLSNFAGGVIIIVMRPFKLGDYISAQGESGTVEDIRMFYTYLNTPDNKVVMIPNGILANGTMINYSTKELRRVDFEFGISYDEDFERAKQVIWDVIDNTENVLMDPKPLVRVNGQKDSCVNIAVKVWVKNSDYWNVYYDITETIKKEFDNANIEIPYNTLDINIKREK